MERLLNARNEVKLWMEYPNRMNTKEKKFFILMQWTNCVQVVKGRWEVRAVLSELQAYEA